MFDSYLFSTHTSISGLNKKPLFGIWIKKELKFSSNDRKSCAKPPKNIIRKEFLFSNNNLIIIVIRMNAFSLSIRSLNIFNFWIIISYDIITIRRMEFESSLMASNGSPLVSANSSPLEVLSNAAALIEKSKIYGKYHFV